MVRKSPVRTSSENVPFARLLPITTAFLSAGERKRPLSTMSPYLHITGITAFTCSTLTDSFMNVTSSAVLISG